MVRIRSRSCCSERARFGVGSPLGFLRMVEQTFSRRPPRWVQQIRAVLCDLATPVQSPTRTFARLSFRPGRERERERETRGLSREHVGGFETWDCRYSFWKKALTLSSFQRFIVHIVPGNVPSAHSRKRTSSGIEYFRLVRIQNTLARFCRILTGHTLRTAFRPISCCLTCRFKILSDLNNRSGGCPSRSDRGATAAESLGRRDPPARRPARVSRRRPARHAAPRKSSPRVESRTRAVFSARVSFSVESFGGSLTLRTRVSLFAKRRPRLPSKAS